MPVNTKTVPHRQLRFESVEQVEAELDSLESAHRAGTLAASGNYSAGQNFHHLARWSEKYQKRDVPVVPLPLKIVGRLMRGRIMSKGFPRGLKGPDGKAQPEPEVSFEDGVSYLRRMLVAMRTEDWSHHNPFLGRLNHDDCKQIQFRHCEHHLGFLHPQGY